MKNHHPNTTIWDNFVWSLFQASYMQMQVRWCSNSTWQTFVWQKDRVCDACSFFGWFWTSEGFSNDDNPPVFVMFEGDIQQTLTRCLLPCLMTSISHPWKFQWLEEEICFRVNRPMFRGLLTVSFREGKCRPCDEIMTEKSQSGLGEYACLPVQG